MRGIERGWLGTNGQTAVNLQVSVAGRVVDRHVACGARREGNACILHLDL